MTALRFVLVCADGPPDHQALRALVDRIRLVSPAPVDIFLDPGRGALSVSGAEVWALDTAGEESSPLPAGWLSAARTLARRCPEADAVFLDPRNPNLSADRLAQAVALLRDRRPKAVVSVAPCRDHPSQWELFFDILASQAYAPVDHDARRTAERIAARLGAGRLPHVSRGIVMPPLGPRLGINDRTRLYEWSPKEGGLRAVDKARPGGEALEDRVFVWLERGQVVRQAAFDPDPLAALPLLTPTGRSPARFVESGQGWLARFAPGLADPSLYQVFALPGQREGYALTDTLRWSKLPAESAPGRGAGVAMEPVRDVPLFLLNILAPSRLPEADLSMPFASENGGWEIDPVTLARTNVQTREQITGRQHFPEVFDWEGSLLGLSAESLCAPLKSLKNAEDVLPLLLDEAEARSDTSFLPEAQPCALTDGRERATDFASETTRHAEDLDRELGSLAALFDRAGRGESGETDSTRELDRLLAALTTTRLHYAAHLLQKEIVLGHVNEVDETYCALLPLRAHAIFFEKGLRRFFRPVEDTFFHPFMARLLGLWERRLGLSTWRAVRSMRERARAMGLPADWKAGLHLACARKGLEREAWQALEQECRATPWLHDEYARIAFFRYRAESSLHEYLAWIERDAKTGRLSADWLLFYCEALGGNGKMKRAAEVTDRFYGKRKILKDCHSAAHWWRYMLRSYAPHRALAGFERDQAADRMTGEYRVLYASALAGAGRFDEACAVIEDVYAKMPGVNSGWTTVGWYYHFVRRRDPERALALIEKDESLGRLDIWSEGSFKACLTAYEHGPEAAAPLVEKAYASYAGLDSYYAQLGMMHWLRHKDDGAFLDYCLKDYERGRLNIAPVQLLCIALLLRAGREDCEILRKLAENVRPCKLQMDICVARLHRFGFRPSDVGRLLPAALRKRILELGRPLAALGDRHVG